MHGNTQPMRKKVTPEMAYEVWQSYDGTWTCFVLKKYQSPEEAFEQISAMVKGNRVCDEQPTVRQRSHYIGQVIMGFAFKDIADGEGGWDYSFRAPSQMAAFPVHLAQKAGVVALPLLVCSNYHRLAVHNYASIEVKNLARHAGRVVRGQEHIGRYKLIRLTRPLHRHLLAKLLNLLFGHGLYNQKCTESNTLIFLTFEEFFEAG